MLLGGGALLASALALGPVQADASAEEGAAASFHEQAGTGSSEVVRRAPSPPAVRPRVPQQPLSELHDSVRRAREAGGQPMPEDLRGVNLPGLKQGDASLRPLVIHTRNGVNTAIDLSSQLTNRLSTPFAKPLLVGVTPESASVQILGSDVYFIPSGEHPLGVYIVNAQNKDQVISLTVVPKRDFPGQNVLLKVEDLAAADNLTSGPGGSTDLPNTAANYTDFVSAVMAHAVKGEIPGYSVVPLRKARAMVGELKVMPDVVFTGANLDVYRYRIRNTASQRLDLTEPAFYRKGVRAVSFFPRLSLSPNEEGFVFILADKQVESF
jgi:conjugal transfer pilus assembly protein TraK